MTDRSPDTAVPPAAMAPLPAPAAATVEHLRRLVGFDTTSRESNLALIGWVREVLAAHGVESVLVHDATGRKANLFATIIGTGGAARADTPGIVLSGHTDVVPVDGQDWATDPFVLAERDGRLHGRGACDMKGFIAAVLAAVPAMARAPLAVPLHLALSYDEEVGCLGVRGLLADLQRRGVRPAACIVGEPTGMEVVRGHKGKVSYRGVVRGIESHSSLAPHGVNAVEYAAEIVALLASLGRRCAAQGPFDPDYDVPHTTVHVGTIRGGTALNIVPRECRFDFEIRHLPADDPARLLAEVEAFVDRELVPRMRAVGSKAGVTFERIGAIPGADVDEAAAIVALAKRAARRNDSRKVAFGSEAGLFGAAGIPAVLCGPGHIAQAHKPDEYVALDQLARCEDFLRRIVAAASDGRW